MIANLLTYFKFLTISSLTSKELTHDKHLLDSVASSPFYEQSYFIVILVISLAASLITIFVLRK